MVRKWNRSRRPRRRKRGFLDRKISLRQVWSKVKYLSSMINSEVHYLDKTQAAQAAASNSSFAGLLTEVVQGDGNSNRTGTSILMKSLLLRGQLNLPPTTTGPCNMRLFIVMDTNKDGTAPTSGDILEDPTNVNSPLEKDMAGRFKILASRQYYLNNGDFEVKTFKFFINKRGAGIHLKYDDSTTEFKNQIWFVVTSDIATGSGPPTIDYYSRFAFYDN